MNVIGCLDTPTSGEYWLEGENICRMNQHQLAQLRCHEIGFIFQSFQLLPRLTALQNVELPLIYAGVPGKQREEIAVQQLHHVGLHDRMTHYPTSFPADSSARRLRALLPPTLPSCWRTSPPARWIRRRACR